MIRHHKTSPRKAFLLIILVLFGHGFQQEVPGSSSPSYKEADENVVAASNSRSFNETDENVVTESSSPKYKATDENVVTESSSPRYKGTDENVVTESGSASYEGTDENSVTAPSSPKNLMRIEETVSGSPENTAVPEKSFVSSTTTHAEYQQETSIQNPQDTMHPTSPNNADETTWSTSPNNADETTWSNSLNNAYETKWSTSPNNADETTWSNSLNKADETKWSTSLNNADETKWSTSPNNADETTWSTSPKNEVETKWSTPANNAVETTWSTSPNNADETTSSTSPKNEVANKWSTAPNNADQTTWSTSQNNAGQTKWSTSPKKADKTPWSRLPNTTGDYCPGANVCIWNNTNTQQLSTNSDVVPCCRDCSCDYETCGKENNCCFPELDIYQSIYKSSQTCSHLHTPITLRRTKTFYIVDKNPVRGCVNAKKNSDTEECGTINVTSWGSLYPAFSNGVLFRNKRCAECHGVTDAVLLPVVQTCGSDKVIFGLSADTLPDNPEFDCFITFKYEMFQEELKRERCYYKVVNDCLPNFEVPQGVRLSKHEIEKACRSGFLSPFMGFSIFANVFCKMCNQVNPFDNVFDACYDQSDQKSDTSSISVLLDPAVLEEMQPSNPERRNEKLACVYHKEKSDCRRVYCPTGMINIKGSCMFASKTIYNADLSVCLKLMPIADTINTTALIEKFRNTDSNENIITLNWVKTSWKKKWKVVQVYNEKHTSSVDEHVKKELKICLVYEPFSVNPEQIMREIQNSLNLKVWTFFIGNETIKMSQSIFECSTSFGNHGTEVFTCQRCTDDIGNMLRIGFRLKTYNQIFQYNVRRKLFLTTITHLLLCEQIELEEHEFVSYCGKNVLYLISRKVFLYSSQFTLVKKSNIKYNARICLYESMFEVSSGSCRSKFDGPIYVVVAYLLTVILLV